MHVCVYCGSSKLVEQRYLDVAADLGARLAQAGHVLVWGAGTVGLMGEVARAVHANAGKVIGVIPEAMISEEVAYKDCDEMVVTQTMRERKAIMDERSDAFIALPGGFGTLEELSEVITHRLLDFHNKPILILNTDGFYDPLLELFEHFVEHKFAKQKHMETFGVVNHPADAIAFLDGNRHVS